MPAPPRLGLPLAVAAALALALPAAAQSHEHGTGDGMAVVLHDGPADGRALVGSLTHFGFALIGKDGGPVVHRNARFEVWQEGALLFATNDTHEYDGLLSFDVTFTRPGPYKVVASSDRMENGTFEGVAVAMADPKEATIEFERGRDDPASNLLSGTFRILGPDGAVLPHTDALVEFREKGTLRLVARTHLHVHEEPIQLKQALGPGTEFVMRVTAYNAYPSEGDVEFRSVVQDFPVTVGRVAVPAAPAAPPVPPMVLRPNGAVAKADGYALYAMYDPQNQVGLGQAARLAALVTGKDGHPLAHVDFQLKLQGPRGVTFESASLHEYDGVFEYLFVPDAPGLYDGTLTADANGTPLTVPFRLQVVPPVAPIAGAGVGVVSVKGLDELRPGVPGEVQFRIAGPQGPVQHSEVDATFWHDGEAPRYQFKLHTHASGDTSASVVLPHAGAWKVTVDPLPTLPQAVVFQGPKGQGQPIEFEVDVPEADAAPGEAAAAVEGSAQNAVPGLPALVAMLAALAIARTLPRRN